VGKDTKCLRDNDLIDVIEIGSRVAIRGQVLKVKALGILGLIDKGRTHCKVIAININDPLADQINNKKDVETRRPELIKETLESFQTYKKANRKPSNAFAFNGEAKNREFTETIIHETHKFWANLFSSTTNLELKNTSLTNNYTIGHKEGLLIIARIKK
jgi:nucleosome-remodeling factor subunit